MHTGSLLMKQNVLEKSVVYDYVPSAFSMTVENPAPYGTMN